MQRRQFLAALAGIPLSRALYAAPHREPDVVYVPTPNDIVQKMLELAAVTPQDVVYDLGCGDGRILIAAAQRYGARGVGINIDPRRVAEASANVRKAGVGDKVRIIEGDLFQADISAATVVTLYLLTRLNARLKPRLLTELKAGTRVVSHAFDMGDWEPEQKVFVGGSAVYLWRVPAHG